MLRADPIAIVGMGCRLPGGVTDPEAFWRLLRDGVDAVREVPAGSLGRRRSATTPIRRCPARPPPSGAASSTPIDGFDAAFFGILPREAERMDPQQRLFLEVAIEALDHAGLPRERLAGIAHRRLRRELLTTTTPSSHTTIPRRSTRAR